MHAYEMHASEIYACCYGSVKMILFSYSSITGKSVVWYAAAGEEELPRAGTLRV
jgi:hypothetical protein